MITVSLQKKVIEHTEKKKAMGEVVKKISQSASDGRRQTVFVLEC